jgi:lipopolysaccharide export LptBFGC system permease protein LptF
MWEATKQFFIDNSAAIIISLIIGAVFFILGPLGLWFSGKKVKREKINKAKSELLDLIESMLVNNEKITLSKLVTLFKAVERQNGNNLGLDSDLNNILEDLTLRFARSKHLSSEQKDGYIERIDGLINSIGKENTIDDSTKREVPKSLKSIITDLKSESEQEKINPKNLKEKIIQLENRLSRSTSDDPLFRTLKLMMSRKYFKWLMIIYLIIIIIVFIIKGIENFG